MLVGTGNGSTLATESLTTLHWIGIVLALVSGVIHLAIGVGSITNPLGVSFVLAGLGFFGAVALLLVDYRRRLLYAVGVPFVGVQIVLWLRSTSNGASRSTPSTPRRPSTRSHRWC
ncbi:MAG: hypothetical protein ABEJ34_08490 [Haloferacaceae archaeon]